MPDQAPSGTPQRARGASDLRDELMRRWSWFLCIAAVLVAYRSSFGFGLVGDAAFLIAENSQMRSWSWLPHVLWSDYFEADAGTSIGYWRPLTKGAWLVETMLGGGSTWVYHASNLAWLAVGALGVRSLALALGADVRAGTLAGALFAVHPALVEPACLVMARSDLACAASATWAVAAWVRWRRGARGWAVVHVAALLGAFASKETAVALLPTFAAWSLLDGDFKPERRRAAFTVLPVVAVTAVYGVLRSAVVEGGGAELALDPTRVLAGAAMYLRAAWPFTFDAGVRNLGAAEAADPTWLVGGAVAGLAVVALVVLCVRRRWTDGVALVVWAAGSVAPVLLVPYLNTPGEAGGAYAFSDRWVAQLVAAFMVFWAVVLSRQPPRVGRIVGAAGAVWVVAAALAGPVVHAAYADPVALLSVEDRDFEATPDRFRTPFLWCRQAERDLLRLLAEDRIDDALAVQQASRERHGCASSLDIDVSLLGGLVRQGRWQEARVVVERITLPEGWRDRSRVALMMGTVLVRTGDPERALPLLEEARRSMPGECSASLARGQALATLGRFEEAARSFETGYDCQLEAGGPDPAVLVAAADTAVRAGLADEALRLLDRAAPIPSALAERAAAIRAAAAAADRAP